jgi:probable F420-dependent oxidoreductase
MALALVRSVLVKIGLYGIQRGNIDPAVLTARARRAEDAGLESLWVGDHLALPADQGGAQPRLDAVVALSYLAAVTTRMRLGVGVIVVPQRHPVMLAKQMTSIDVLTRGRLILGVAAGYVEPELAALGVPLSERAARTDEYLAAMRELWTAPEPRFEGRFVTFDGVVQVPRPVQRPHPPIVVGGHSEAAMRRAGRVGTGWYGVYVDLQETATLLARLREVTGRTDLEITITPREEITRDVLARYEDLGVHRLLAQPESLDDDSPERLIDALSCL